MESIAINTLPYTPYLPFPLLQNSLNRYSQNSFIKYLIKLLGAKAAEELIKEYYIGTSDSWEMGAAVFWFIDKEGIIQAGQITHFKEEETGENYCSYLQHKNISSRWLPNVLKDLFSSEGKKMPEWFRSYVNDKSDLCCLFGEHLLNTKENLAKPVAVVKSPETAVIASAYLPQYVWVALGSNFLILHQCRALAGKRVVLFPDLNSYDNWNSKVGAISSIAEVKVSMFLERKATIKDRYKGLTIAEYLVRFPFSDYLPQVLELKMCDVVRDLGNCHTGQAFGHIIIQGIAIKDGKVYDLLYHADGTLVQPHELKKEVTYLAFYFEKILEMATFDGVPCWVHRSKNNLYNFDT